MQFNTSGEGVVGPSDQTTPRTPHTAPFLSNKYSETCSATPLRLVEGVDTADQHTPDHVE